MFIKFANLVKCVACASTCLSEYGVCQCFDFDLVKATGLIICQKRKTVASCLEDLADGAASVKCAAKCIQHVVASNREQERLSLESSMW